MKRIPLCFSRHVVPAVGLLLVFLAPLAQAAPYAYVANSGDNTVSVIDTATDTVTATVSVGTYPTSVAVSPDGRQVYVANTSSNTVSVIDTATNTVTATVDVGNNPRSVAVSPNGNRVYVANFGDNSVSIIDTATDTVTATMSAGNYPIDMAVSPDGSRVYVANYISGSNGTVSVIDTATNTVTATVTVGFNPYGLAVSPDGRRVYVANSNSNTVSVIDTATNTVTATVSVGNSSYDVAVSPDGRRVYVANNSNTVSVIDTATNTVTATVGVGNSSQGVAVSPDGRRVYLANTNSNTVSVIDTATDATVGSPITVGYQPVSLGDFVGPGALIATNSSASGGAGSQVSGTVPTLINNTSPACSTTDTLVQSPTKGSVSFAASTGAYTYTPTSATYSGPDSFTWLGQAASICSAAYSPILPVSNTATVTLTLDPLLTGLANLVVAPGASGQAAFSLTGSTPFTHTLTSDNATVLPPADLTVSPAACGAAGNLSCVLGVTAATVPGTASVTVTATDIYGDPVKKTLLVTVDNAPTASNGTLSTNTNTVANSTLSATDPDNGQTLTYTIVKQPAHGTVSITNASTGTYTYTPATGYAGNDSFTFMANDGYLDSNTATVSITVNDNAPTAINGNVTTSTGTAVNGALSASNPNSGQILTYSIVTQPAHGTVMITNASLGAFTYTPDPGYAGSDSFTFKVNDGYLDSNTALVAITVADTTPTALNANYQSVTNQAFNGQLQGSAGSAGQTLTFALDQAPAHGKVTVNADGSFSYTPSAGYAGNDAFTFVVNDGYLNSAPAMVSIVVNDGVPTAINASFSTPVDTAYSGQLQASDPDTGQTLTYSIVSQPAHGSVTITDAGTGAYAYTPNSGYIGADSFTFRVNDGYQDSNVATVSATVNDTAPVAKSASYNVRANSSYSGQLQATASGSGSGSGQTLTYAIVTQPANGTVSLDSSTGAFVYIPNQNYTGTDSFTFKANDGTLDSNTATVTLTISASQSGSGAFGPWGLALLAGLALLIALGRKHVLSRSSNSETGPDKK